MTILLFAIYMILGLSSATCNKETKGKRRAWFVNLVMPLLISIPSLLLTSSQAHFQPDPKGRLHRRRIMSYAQTRVS
jgi:hypothetical protein